MPKHEELTDPIAVWRVVRWQTPKNQAEWDPTDMKNNNIKQTNAMPCCQSFRSLLVHLPHRWQSPRVTHLCIELKTVVFFFLQGPDNKTQSLQLDDIFLPSFTSCRAGVRHFAFFTPQARLRLTLMHVNTSSEGSFPHFASRCVGMEVTTGCPRGTSFFKWEYKEQGAGGEHILAAWARSSAAPLSASYQWRQLKAR